MKRILSILLFFIMISSISTSVLAAQIDDRKKAGSYKIGSENVTVYTTSTIVYSTVIEGDVYIAPSAVATFHNVTIKGNVYVLGGARFFNSAANGLYGSHVNYGNGTMFYNGMVYLIGTNSVGFMDITSSPVTTIPCQLENNKAYNVDGKLYIKGQTLKIATFYINNQKVELDEKGCFDVRNIKVNENNTAVLKWHTVFGNNITKTITLEKYSEDSKGYYKIQNEKEATCEKKGSYEKVYYSVPGGTEVSRKTIQTAALGHKWGSWTTVSKATVFSPEKKQRTCKVCGKEKTQSVGNKLKPTISLSVSSLSLEIGQSADTVKVSGLAEGDSVKSWKSSNTQIVKVSTSGKITAQKTAGKATVTVTLASGKTASVSVTVNTPKTQKITGLSSKITLNKGKKTTLKPGREPVASNEKFTYVSSNEKVASVSEKGVVQAKAAGTARITVKCGSAKFVVTVTVPKVKTTAIKNVKTSISIKKGETYTLKPTLTPAVSDESITYTTSDAKIAPVSSKGVIKGLKKGKAVITVQSGSKSVKCTVTVK